MIENFPSFYFVKDRRINTMYSTESQFFKIIIDSAILVSPEFLFIQPFKTISELKKSFREEFLSETCQKLMEDAFREIFNS